MDAAAKPPWTGLRRLLQPDPPRLPTGNQLLLLLFLLLLRLPASGRHYCRCRAQPCRTLPLCHRLPPLRQQLRPPQALAPPAQGRAIFTGAPG